MSGGFNRGRIAMVKAAPADADREPVGSVSTGYFLTGDLVLTAGHASQEGWKFRVRAEGDGLEASRWCTATRCWRGEGRVDAMLLRTEQSFGNWALPAFLTAEGGGTKWESSGYAAAAADDNHNDRKTLPLSGTFGPSLGQGPPELSLQTDQHMTEHGVKYWEGVSGAPVFTAEPAGDAKLAGVITEARGNMPNALVGLPVAPLLADADFRLITSAQGSESFPGTPRCLVLTSERQGGETASWLKGKVSDVLARHHKEPQFTQLKDGLIEIPALDAIRSVKNWTATVKALACADYLIADVTGFEPAVMLLLGIRSVLRRGVTISVIAEKSAAAGPSIPFNVRETRVLSYAEPRDFDKNLYQLMVEGADYLRQDANYLDLPAYQAVRVPRPPWWAEDDRDNILILCSFGKAYSQFYDGTLESIISAQTAGERGDRRLLRMMDLTSPRLVGQALYEQIRWCPRCLVDWTDWRPNVFFELGVRLACSERDPLCIIRSDHESGPVGGDGREQVPPAGLEQYELLRKLLEPVQYNMADPHGALNDVLKSWSGQSLPGVKRKNPWDALPAEVTFKTCQDNFAWQQDEMLAAPHVGQREIAEIIFDKDPDRKPERLVLFSDNAQFERELRAAGRENWIAAWLYLNHLSNADDAKESDKAELAKIAYMVEYALSSSKNPRHNELRKEIRDFLRSRRPGAHGRGSGDSSG